MKPRKIISLTMLTSFVLLVLTSVILFIEPQGRVAYWSDWRLWGLSKTQWGDLHLNLGALFLLAGIFHLVYNWKVITAYLKDKAKHMKVFTPNFNLALAVTFVVAAGTLLNLPPMSTLVSMGSRITERANQKYGEPPYGHAELSSLRMFAKRTDLDLEKTLILLKEAGVDVTHPGQTILQIAKAHRMTPKALYDIIRPATVRSEGHTLPDSPPPGFGRRTITQVCEAYGLELQDLLRYLGKNGIQAAPEGTIKQIAEQNGKNPMAIFEAIHDFPSRGP